MKKIWICLLMVMLLGCQGNSSDEKADTMTWEGQYKKENITVIITMESDFPDGFKYDFRYNGEDMSDYATYEDKQKKTAMCAVTEDGYTIRFTLEKGKVIIEEMDGISYLDIALSGDYLKE